MHHLYFLLQVFDLDPNPFVIFDPIKKWEYGKTQKFHYTIRRGIEPDSSPWDYIGLYKVNSMNCCLVLGCSDPGVILQIRNREKFWPFSVILMRSDCLSEYIYISYVKLLLPELEKGRSGTVLGDNFSHLSLQDDPWVI